MKQKLKIWLQNFFGFSRTETNGFIILIILMLITLLAPLISRKVYSFYDSDLQTQEDKNKLQSFLELLENNTEVKEKKVSQRDYQPFDLNKSDANQLVKAGFPKFLAERIVKYRQKVKPFDSKAELLKIYGLDSSFYSEIHPYIEISKVRPVNDQELAVKKKNTTVKTAETEVLERKKKSLKLTNFDINTADTLKLQKIHGIGPAYSQRIVKYRELLGGFHSLQQLHEVYGLKRENLDSLKNYVFVSSKLNLKQLKVNLLNADSLVQHPYISYKEANLIVNYRNQHGAFKSVKDLLSIIVLDSNWVEKVQPYLSFD